MYSCLQLCFCFCFARSRVHVRVRVCVGVDVHVDVDGECAGVRARVQSLVLAALAIGTASTVCIQPAPAAVPTPHAPHVPAGCVLCCVRASRDVESAALVDLCGGIGHTVNLHVEGASAGHVGNGCDARPACVNEVRRPVHAPPVQQAQIGHSGHTRERRPVRV